MARHYISHSRERSLDKTRGQLERTNIDMVPIILFPHFDDTDVKIFAQFLRD